MGNRNLGRPTVLPSTSARAPAARRRGRLLGGSVPLAVALVTAGASCATPASKPGAVASGHRIEGRVLVPPGVGPRGVEVRLDYPDADGGPPFVWVRHDPSGRFTHTSTEWPTNVRVHAAGVDVYRAQIEVDAGRLATDLGVIDVREQLVPYRVELAASPDAPAEVVRVAVWSGSPPRGPRGELPSLGSAQFPERGLPSTTDWLLPVDAPSISILVEQPAGRERDRNWKTGRQEVFGPYPLGALPDELVVE